MTNTTLYSHAESHLEVLGLKRALTLVELTDIFSDLPDNLCERTALMMHLYEDGALAEELTFEIESHLSACPFCKERLKKNSELVSELGSSMTLQLAISDQEVDQSLDRFMSQYRAELFGEIVSHEVEQENRISHLTLEIPPPQKKNRSTRVQAFGGLLFAAALLFAYGPALIEGPVEEATYPEIESSQGQAVGDVELTLNHESFPLAKLIGAEMTTQDQSTRAKLLGVTPVSQQGATNVALYSLDFKGAKYQIEMTQARLQSAQAKRLYERLSVSGERLGELSIRSIRSDKVIFLEYVIDGHHVQWATHELGSEDVLKLLAEQHYQETL